MLKFLDNRKIGQEEKPSIKFRPQMVYGISIETPQNFQKPNTIVNNNTYANPYLSFELKRQSSLSLQKKKDIQPTWTKKNNLNLIEQHNIFKNIENSDPNSELLNNSKFHTIYHRELKKSQSRFRIIKGQLSNFIQKNNNYKSIAPLYGNQRCANSIFKGCKFNKNIISTKIVRDNKHQLGEKQGEGKVNLEYSRKSAVSAKFSNLGEKNRVKQRRGAFQSLFHNEIHLKKIRNPFGKHSDCDMNILIPLKKVYNKENKQNQLSKSTYEPKKTQFFNWEQLENFEKKLLTRFK